MLSPQRELNFQEFWKMISAPSWDLFFQVFMPKTLWPTTIAVWQYNKKWQKVPPRTLPGRLFLIFSLKKWKSLFFLGETEISQNRRFIFGSLFGAANRQIPFGKAAFRCVLFRDVQKLQKRDFAKGELAKTHGFLSIAFFQTQFI